MSFGATWPSIDAVARLGARRTQRRAAGAEAIVTESISTAVPAGTATEPGRALVVLQ